MLVLDSSAIIPLLKIGKLSLIQKNFKTVFVPQEVWNEVVEQGKRIGKKTDEFEKGKNLWFTVVPCSNHERCCRFAKEQDIEPADAEVLLLAQQKKAILLTNDAGLYACCLVNNVIPWWLTTLLLASVKKKLISKANGETALLELVHTAHMHLHVDILAELLGIMKNL